MPDDRPGDERGRILIGVDAGRDAGPHRAVGIGVPRGGSTPGGRIVFGLVLVGLGVLFTLDNLGLVKAGEVLRWWPVLLVAYGLGRLTGTCCKQDTVLGIIFAGAGVLILLHAVGFLHLDPWDFWPIVLIVIGGSMLNGAVRRARGREQPGGGAEDASAVVSTVAVWSGIERKVVSPVFRGGDVVAIMGGAEIDLRPARMESGSAVVDVTVIWGGVDLYVPPDWKVSVEAVPLLGGIEDSTHPPAGEARGHLVVRGVVLMGGLEVKG